MSGRQGVPSLMILPVVWAQPTRLLRTRSTRSRAETPYAVALRIETGAKLGPARSTSASSERTFDSEYTVRGFSGALSSTVSSEEVPYMLQDDENTKRRTPASRDARARETVAS